MAAPIRVVHESDPKQDIVDEGKHLIKDWKVMAARVLIVMYERGKQKSRAEVRTAGGIIVPDTGEMGSLGTEKFQSKVGLVMKVGPLAFQDDETHRWGGVIPEIGDWVQIDVSRTIPFDMPNGRRGRYVEDVDVYAILPDIAFDAVW